MLVFILLLSEPTRSHKESRTLVLNFLQVNITLEKRSSVHVHVRPIQRACAQSVRDAIGILTGMFACASFALKVTCARVTKEELAIVAPALDLNLFYV